LGVCETADLQQQDHSVANPRYVGHARPAAASIVAVVGALLSRQFVQAGSLLP